MNQVIKTIWQKALELGFAFNETDAHEMYLAIKNQVEPWTVSQIADWIANQEKLPPGEKVKISDMVRAFTALMNENQELKKKLDDGKK